MNDVKHRPSDPQHLEAAAHSERVSTRNLLAHTSFIVIHQAHIPHGQKLYAVEHQSHPLRHHALGPLNEPQQ
jgi:hypothetical protein